MPEPVPHAPFLAPWRFLLLRRSCCPSDVAGGGLKRRQTIGLKGDVTIGLKGGVEEGSDPIAALADRKVASDEANPYARRRVVLAWQPAERYAPGAQLHSTRVDQCGASSRSKLMHLLVLSAFRREEWLRKSPEPSSLNAPSGAECFPTR